LDALEGMTGVVQHFEQMRRDGAFRNEGRANGSGGGGNEGVSESSTPTWLPSKEQSLTSHDWDWRRIEVLDDEMAEVLRRKTPAERIAIGFGLWRSARKILRAQLASLHPEWDARRLEHEIARRLSARDRVSERRRALCCWNSGDAKHTALTAMSPAES
ncbi:MAG TPA: hypothetical protein VE131_02165, partial [Terriglobales bacterium]|nr:hypothetical protein [Terriglobales bacterium]